MHLVCLASSKGPMKADFVTCHQQHSCLWQGPRQIYGLNSLVSKTSLWYVLQAVDIEAVLKCCQLGVYEPPGLMITDTGLTAAVKRITWRYKCLVQVRKS